MISDLFSWTRFSWTQFSRTRHRRAAVLGAVASLAGGLAQSAEGQVLPPNPNPTCRVAPSEFAGWFKTRPGLNQPVNEADSIALDTSNNCNFYKWSAQMFLWLTSPATGPYQGNRVLDSQVFYQVNNDRLVAQSGFGPRNLALRAAKSGPDGLPVVMDSKGHLREFVVAPSRAGLTARNVLGGEGPAAIARVRTGDGGKAEFLDAAGKPVATFTPKVTTEMLPQALGRLVQLAASPRSETALRATTVRQQIADALTAKKILIKVATSGGPVFIEAGTGIIDNLGPGQAGGNGVLLSQRTAVIFYEVLVNDVYAWYLTGRKTPNGIAPFYVGSNSSTYGLFPTSAPDLSSIVAFAKSHGGPSNFPDGKALAIEAKLSWVDATTLPNGAQGYVTANAIVPVYDTSDSADWAPVGSRFATVALVGAHIVGGTKGHPEMVWATFEHQANSPLATYQYNSDGRTVTVPQNTSGAWLLSASGATGTFNTELAQYKNSNQHIVATTPAPIGPSNILRQKAWGVASNGIPNQEDRTPADASTQVISLDTDVRAKLNAAGASADPRFNYLLIGSTWTLGGGEPNGAYPTGPGTADEIGTSMLANSSMETFMQGSDTTFGTGTNCFSCHTSSGSNPKVKADTSVSHFFGSIQPMSFAAQKEP